MATIAKAAEIITEYPDLADFVGAVPFEEVWVAEQALGVTFPESYRDFLQKYGSGSFGGLTVFGIGVPDDGLPHVVWATHSLQEQDDWFPGDLVVIQDPGEGDILCLATGRVSPDYPGECPVVQWIPEMSFEEQAFEEVHKTFAHFLLRMVKRTVGA
jgi:antitoxin YobK